MALVAELSTDLDVQPKHADLLRYLEAQLYPAVCVDTSGKSAFQNPRAVGLSYPKKVRNCYHHY
jgi:hypothetical protein